jgi:tetratricopeptide (TPR) repeat protein
MWWIHILGFEGDQQDGLSCLEFASRSDDVKAPLATLALVWYHTTVRPFFSLDGTNLAAGVNDAARVLDYADKEFPDSALFLYFKSRIYRLQGNTKAALDTCQRALEMSANQRETQHICLYEIGRLSMTRMQYKEAYDCFIKLKVESRWSKCFYGYLSGLCLGSLGKLDEAMSLMAEVPKLVQMKNNQLELFISRRAQQAYRMKANREQLQILGMEVLYMWTLISGCSETELHNMLTACHSEKVGSLNHLKCLVEGVIYNELKKTQEAEECFREAISSYESSSNNRDDMHVAAFANFELGMLKGQEAASVADLQESKKHFLRVKSHYKNYDLEHRLSVKVSAALKRISDAEKAESSGGKGCIIQ